MDQVQGKFSISGKEIGSRVAPWIIAEMSANHNGQLERALSIIDAAAEAGAHAVKLQTYTPDTMTLNIQKSDFVIKTSSLWQGRSLYDLYEQAQTPWGWHQLLFERCREKGVVGFSSPFDETAVDLLEKLQVPCYKVASLEILDHELLRCIASTHKPIFMSTGAARLFEIEEALNAIERAGGGPVILLKCTSAYPTPYDQANLKTIEHLANYFNRPVGLSDHTLGIATSLAATALGACAIEKHFCLNRRDGGVDSAFSLEPAELRQLCHDSKIVWESLGHVYYGPTPGEALSHSLRRSLYITRPVQAGERVDSSSVRAIRPGAGLAPKYWDRIQGMVFASSVPAGTPLSWDLLQTDSSRLAPFLLKAPKRVLAIVQARMGSTRFPGKVLAPLGSRPMLEWIIKRLECSKTLADVVVATTQEPEDDAIVKLCQDLKVTCIRGSSSDVLSRYIKTGQELQADAIVRITSDCPLVDPDLVDEFVNKFLANFDKYHVVSNALERTYARGLDIEVFSFCALQDLEQQKLSLEEKEHVTLGFYQRSERYCTHTLKSAVDLAHYRWTVDTVLDYAYMQKIYEDLETVFERLIIAGKGCRKEVTYPWTASVLDYLKEQTKWSHYNALVHQKKPG